MKITPNGLSWSRAVVGCLLPIAILQDTLNWTIFSLIVFGVAAFTDFLDGWLARKQGLVSDTGKWLDPLADKLLVFGPLIAFAHYGLFSMLWVGLIIFRDVVVTFCRQGWVLEGKTFGAEKSGKIKFFFQVVVVLLSFVFLIAKGMDLFQEYSSQYSNVLRVVVILTALFTVYSGYLFLHHQREHFKSDYFAKYFLAMGVGLLPKAPGTWGSLLTVVIAFALKPYLWAYLAVFALVWWLGYVFYQRIRSKECKDPSFVVIDEFCGVMLVFLFFPMNFWYTIGGFVLFRLFDIFKPFPAKQSEKLPGFLGVVVDDLVAGVYAILALKILDFVIL